MIRMVLEINHDRGLEDLFCPQFFCDACGNRIEGAANGLYLAGPRGPLTGELFHVHKGDCDRGFVSLHPAAGDARWYWLELLDLPIQLASNLGMGDTRRALATSLSRRILRDEGKRALLDPRRSFSREEKGAIYRQSGGKCSVCGLPLGPNWHADHIVPHSRGGRTDLENAMALCPRCNQRKHAKFLSMHEE